MEGVLITLVVLIVIVAVALAFIQALPAEYAKAQPLLKLVVIGAALLYLLVRFIPLLR